MHTNQYTKGDRVPWKNVERAKIGCVTEAQAEERAYWDRKIEEKRSILPTRKITILPSGHAEYRCID
jgi:hypothetical protein